MGLDVISIDELANLPVFTRGSSLEFLDLFDDDIYIAFSAGGEHEFRAIRLNGFLTLFAHTIRHDDDNGVAFGSAHAGGGDAGVACSAFDDAHTRTQITAPLGL